MKRYAAMLLMLALLLSLAACKKEEAPQTEPTLPELTEAETVIETTEAPEIYEEMTDAPAWTGEEPEFETHPAVEEVPEPVFELDPKFERVEETVYATRDVNIRTEPTVNSRSPGKLKKGQSAERIGISKDGWSAVILDEQLRYIASKYLTTQEPQQGGGGGKVTESPASGTMYTKGDVNLRKGPGADTPGLTTIPKGTAVEQLAICTNGWIKVNYAGTVGYVAGNFLTAQAPAEPTVPETTVPETTVPETTVPGTSEPAATTVPETTVPAATKEPEQTVPPTTKPAATEGSQPDDAEDK